MVINRLQVRDRRAGNRYFIDNAFLRGGWGHALGPHGIAVYNALALHADADSQEAYPSLKKIEDLTHVSARQVLRELEKLVAYNIIHIQSRQTKRKPSIITLLNQSEWTLPGPEHMTPSHKTPSLKTPSRETYDSESYEQDSYNKTQLDFSSIPLVPKSPGLPRAVDSHQRRVDEANGGNALDPVLEVARHLRYGCAGAPGVPLPTATRARKTYLDAGRQLLENTDANDWHAVCAAIDGWFESPPAEDVWRRERTKDPHFALAQLAAYYWHKRNGTEHTVSKSRWFTDEEAATAAADVARKLAEMEGGA
jgi:hypothetical protein